MGKGLTDRNKHSRISTRKNITGNPTVKRLTDSTDQ